MTCLDDDAIVELLAERLDDDARRAIVAHLDACTACRQLVAAAATDDDGADADADPRRLRAGATIGRYVVARVLGVGAMGVVYAARDPQLDRDVAVKLLRREALAARADDADALLREAQTLARLSHPNVITLYEAAADRGQLFLAMELVHGRTLRQWLGDGARSWLEVRDVFVQAGRGLAAAHAAGLVHRDFKPDNVLVGDDGRVRVTDFGLARGIASDERAAGSPSEIASSRVLAGTPAYMSSEQLAGEPVDARADQYAFCVALHEALFGHRPRARTAPVVSPRRRGIPRRVHRALARGLAPAAAARFASMDALLAELARGPIVTWRRALVAAMIVGAIGGGALLRTALVDDDPPACTGARAAWGPLWDAAQHAAVRAAFAATARADADDVFARVAATLDGYRDRWLVAHTETCLASQRGEQSAARLDQRMICLADRRTQVAAAVALLAGADGKLVDHAIDLAHGLAPVAECATAPLTGELAPLPRDGATRATYDALQAQLAQAKAAFDVDRHAACSAAADAALEPARRLGYPPLLARLYYYRGRCELGDDKILADLHAAGAAALAGGDRQTLAMAWIRLMYVTGFARGQWDEARRWQAYARGVIDRLGGDDELELMWRSAELLNLHRQGQLDEARAVAESMRPIALRHDGADSAWLARIELAIANSYTDAWRFREAIAHHQRALALYEHVYGVGRPIVLDPLLNLATDLCGAGRAAEALPLFPRMFALSRLVDGSDGDDSTIRHRHAYALRETGDPAAALDEDRRALATCARLAGPDVPRCAPSYEGVARDLVALGRPAEAVAPIRRALALQPEPTTAFVLARALERSDPAGARDAALDALANMRSVVADRHGDRADLDAIEAWLRAHGGVPPIASE